jgi:competence protein ComEA
VAVSVVSACGGAAPEPEESGSAGESVSVDGQVLLEERCTECHALNRTTSASKSREEWEQTVTRMIGHGAELNEEEQTVLIDYLVENYGP